MTGALPSHMQAAVLSSFANLAQGLTVESRALPVLKPKEVLIRMAAASINPSDLVFLRNLYGVHKKLPVIPGFEGSGTVVAAAGGFYGRWLIGKRVACRASEDGDGTWAEFMACPAAGCIPLKRMVSFEQGASFYVNPLTAWYLLRKVRRQGHDAFIQTAAASAVGRMLCRLARRKNIPAIHVVRRSEHVALLKADGAEHVLDSSSPHFLESLKVLSLRIGATIAVDAVGGSLTGLLAQALPRGGQVLVYGALAGSACEIGPAELIFKGQSLSGFWLTQSLPKMNVLEKLHSLWAVQDLLGTDLRTDIQASLPLEKIHEAIQRYKADRTKGKILLVFPRA